MAFSDPITVTINAVAKALVKIREDGYSSEYLLRETDRNIRMKIRQSTYVTAGVKVNRHVVELSSVIYATSTSKEISRKASYMFEAPESDGDIGLRDFVLGHVGFLTQANVVKLINLES